MKRITLIFTITILVILAFAQGSKNQRFVTKNGRVTLTYQAPHGQMQTVNRQVNVGYNQKTGELRLNMAMLSFRFESAYNQEKFNEYFIANPHFSNSTFKGFVENYKELDFTRKGEYDVIVKGELTLRQFSKEVSAKGKFIVTDDAFTGKTTFKVNLKDFNFNIPSSMEKFIEVSFDVSMKRVQGL